MQPESLDKLGDTQHREAQGELISSLPLILPVPTDRTFLFGNAPTNAALHSMFSSFAAADPDSTIDVPWVANQEPVRKEEQKEDEKTFI